MKNQAKRYRIPIETQRTEITVVNSRFITTIGNVTSTEDVKGFLDSIRSEMPDASHHVYAFRVGFGNSVTEGMSDDGEPSGTSGPPVLAVLRGTEIGDVIVVVTRYFGGTKLGTGGLVRAYSDAARTGLSQLNTIEKIEKVTVGIDMPYHWYEQVKRLLVSQNGEIQDEMFAAEVSLIVTFPVDDLDAFTTELINLTAGQVNPIALD